MTRILLVLILASYTLPLWAKSNVAVSIRADTSVNKLEERLGGHGKGSASLQRIPSLFPVGTNIVFNSRLKPRYKYDIKREAGAYTFDTLYKLWMPGAKHISIDLHGGYTYFDRYASISRSVTANTSGMLCGFSVMKIGRTIAATAAHSKCRKKGSYLRFNADAVTYPNRKVAGTKSLEEVGPSAGLVKDLSARIYLDGRITSWYRKGAFTIRYAIGIGTEAAKVQGASQLFVGFGLGYRFL